MDSRRVLRVIRAHRLASDQLRGRTSRLLARMWDGMGDYRADNVEAFARRAASLVTGAQRDVAELEQAYLARLAAAIREEQVRPAGLDPRQVTGAAVRGGTDPREVYRRPGKEVWTALAAGAAPATAIARGRHRVLATGATDLQLARTHTAREVLARDGQATGYRRVLGPTDNCELCVTAAQRTYSTEELMPLHPGCQCDVAPIYGSQDPSSQLPKGAAGAELSEDLLVTRRHGEIGPTLARREHRFTGPAAVS